MDRNRFPDPSKDALDHDPLLRRRIARVRLMIFDVDGVLTDGGLYYGPDGEAIKRFNVLDGLGIKLIQEFGIVCAIITARNSVITARRAQDLKIAHVFQGSHDKLAQFARLTEISGIPAEDCGYIGDDIIDLPLMKKVGLAVAVANGTPITRAAAHYCTQAAGGHGAVRELCDMLLHAQGHYAAALAKVAEVT